MLTLDNKTGNFAQCVFNQTFSALNQELTGLIIDTASIISANFIYFGGTPSASQIDWTVLESHDSAMAGATEVDSSKFIGGKISSNYTNSGLSIGKIHPQNGVFGTKRYIQVKGKAVAYTSPQGYAILANLSQVIF